MFKKVSLIIPALFLCLSTAQAELQKYAHYNDPLELASLFLPEDPVILESGAHWGEDTSLMNWKWPKSTIHAFEPNPPAYAELEKGTAHLPNVHRWPYALFDVNSPLTFYVVASNDGASSLLEPGPSTREIYAGPRITVDAVRLDDWAKANDVKKIDFMWLDMEGAELKMLQAAKRILKTVQVIFTETNFWSSRHGTAQYSEVASFLKKRGFVEVRHWIGPGQGNAMFVRKKNLKN